jgi:hypothetical protein
MIVTIIFAMSLIIYNIINKKEVWNIIPLLLVIPAVFGSSFSNNLSLWIMTLATIAVSGASISNKKMSVYTMFSVAYLIFTFEHIHVSYLKETLFIIWSVSHFYFIKQNKYNSLFQFLSYISMLILYNSIIKDLGVDTYTAFRMGGYIIVSILTLRTILAKYVKDSEIDILEYFTFGCIYLLAITQYNNETDGMIFGILIIGVIFASYIKRYGALFMVSILAILANVFILTRVFWISTVPWWAYLLGIGIILIAFAIRNEATDKKENMKALNILKNIKDKVDNG